ncbi:MAG TPA: hypothetical protein VNU66_13240 [Mycobacteriales bacterium]|nr:hypothetical protein [Mycobacteriales bacterium]
MTETAPRIVPEANTARSDEVPSRESFPASDPPGSWWGGSGDPVLASHAAAPRLIRSDILGGPAMAVLATTVPTPRAPRLGERIVRQVQAIDAFHRSRQGAGEEAPLTERHVDALLWRTDEGLRQAGASLLQSGPTALVTDRSPSRAAEMASLLEARSVEVVGRTPSGPEAVGWAVAEQPDLIVADDSLGADAVVDVVRQLRALCPHALVAVRVSRPEAALRVLEAGAHAVHVRRLAADLVARELTELLDERRTAA